MRIEKIDNSTIKCYLTEEELHEYDVECDDFVTRTDKAKQVVRSIMLRAEEEVGYQPPRFSFDLQIMVVPGDGLVLTFSEKQGVSEHLGRDLGEALNELKRMIDEFEEKASATRRQGSGAKGSESGDINPEDTVSEDIDPQESKSQESKEPAEFAIFEFSSMRDIVEYASILPANLRIDSALYKMDNAFYVIIYKGSASYERYSRACVQAMEFAHLYSASWDKVKYMEEHGECLGTDKVLKKLAVR